MSDIKINKENLTEIIAFLSNENLLSDSAISELNFTIANFFALIKGKTKYEEQIFHYHIECSMANLYNLLKQNTKYNTYADQVKSCIENPMNELVVKEIEELLKLIMDNEFPSFYDKEILIMNR